MSSILHPDTDQLTAYMLEPTGGKSRQISLHLIECRDCRTQLKLITELREHMQDINTEQFKESIKTDADFVDMLDKHKIEEYIDARLDEDSAMQVRHKLLDNTQALKAALHYASHSACMERGLSTMSDSMSSVESANPSHLKPGSQEGVMSRMKHWLHSRVPLWLTIPATAALAGVLSITVLPHGLQFAQNPSIIAYQDNPVIQFRQGKALPGMGFFSNANKQAQPYDGIVANVLDKNVIQLQWPEVQGATSYTIHLKIFKMGQQISVGRLTTTQHQASFKRADQDTGYRYVWSLHGKTGAGELFSTKGGFIIQPD